MSTLANKIDFEVVFSVTDANPNGDPLSGNRPRTNSQGHGEMSDVCIKRKIRNRLQDMGEKIFVQSNDRCDDKCDSLKTRVDSCAELNKKKVFLTHWQNRKQDVVMHPFLKEKVEWGLLPYIQALLLSRYIRGDLDEYPMLLWR